MGALDPLGLTPSAWETFVAAAELPRYRARQLFDAFHRRGSRDYAAMTELPGALRERLAAELPVRLPEIARRDESADGSVKFGLRLSDGALIEAVYMPGSTAFAQVNEFTDARAVVPDGPPTRHARHSTPPVEKFTVCLSFPDRLRRRLRLLRHGPARRGPQPDGRRDPGSALRRAR